jgi:hypothetical protein
VGNLKTNTGMKKIRSWALLMALVLLCAGVYAVNDWELYVVAFLIGLGSDNLFGKQ